MSMTGPKTFGMIVFPGWQSLDVFGCLGPLNFLAREHPEMSLSIISATKGPVSTQPSDSVAESWRQSFSESIVATHTFEEIQDLDVLLIPGGGGLRAPIVELQPYVEFIKRVAPGCQYVISICTGAALLAKAGVLDGRRATTNKAAWKFTSWGPRTNWIAQARWVQDGTVWTSAGVSAGMDVTLAWIGSIYGETKADEVARLMEYTRVRDSSDDPFSKLYECKDVPAQS